MTLPLGSLKKGERAEIVDSHVRKQTVAKTSNSGRVQELGVRTGKVVEMLNNAGGGPILFKVDDTRIALARALAMDITVKRMA
ncbi:MAG: ferrous iron transport protein A [Magnetococcales bacterium]|uniref:Ferrous iron transport protein A n=2 Tax=Candidatus Magnetobacterium casense TaxID=1455061 RepID=A0ABS6S1W4_9BACT|nr:ferrous iron transport protein A [Nitrospirota bacterium]MBV6342841.1 ferrous iron transport protein A [Candidatus Magnetobacterium casensis]